MVTPTIVPRGRTTIAAARAVIDLEDRFREISPAVRAELDFAQWSDKLIQQIANRFNIPRELLR